MELRLTKNFLFAFAGAAGVIAAIGAASIYLLTPVHLKIAVGPADGADARIMQTINRMLEKERRGIRLNLVTTKGLEENFQKLKAKEVDLSIIRVDAGWPEDTGAVVKMRTNALIAAAVGARKFESITDLKNKHVGIVARTAIDEPSILKVFAAFGLKDNDVKHSVVKPADIPALTKSGKLDAIVVVGVPSDPEVADLVASVYSTKASKPTILAVDVGDFVDTTTAVATAVTIPKNAFPRLQIPGDDVQSIGTATMLVANEIQTGPIRQKAYNDGVAALTKMLLESHNQVGRVIPLANLIAAPDTDKDARFPLHPGASAYLNDNMTSWADMFSDQIWNIMLVAGLISSGITTFMGILRRDDPDPIADIIGRIKAVTSEAEASNTNEQRAALTPKVNKIAADLAELAHREQLPYERLAPVLISMETARHNLRPIA